jgi:hypothetical protein
VRVFAARAARRFDDRPRQPARERLERTRARILHATARVIGGGARRGRL